jgi:hypothetical protein
VRIHGERLRLLERRDTVRDRLIDAMASGQTIRRVSAPSESKFDLAGVGKAVISINVMTMVMILSLQFIAGREARWVLGWPPDSTFWMFMFVDVVAVVLVIISVVDWLTVRNYLRRDKESRPWTRLDQARCAISEAVGKPFEERPDLLDDARSILIRLTFNLPEMDRAAALHSNG